jgi:hypothetical protein
MIIFKILLLFVSLLMLPPEAHSDSPVSEDKVREPYPGEEFSLPDGKKVRRWSTRGPVEVSAPPQPFDQTDQQRAPGGLLLNVDPVQLQQNRRVPPRVPGGERSTSN